MNYIALIMISCLLTSCVLTRDYVGIQYKPYYAAQRICGAENVEVSVTVCDYRAKNNIGYKCNSYGMEMANIMPANDVSEVFKNAIIWEMINRGFVISNDGSRLNVEICKFYNDYKIGFFSAVARADTVLNVTLRKRDCTMVYSKAIFGFGEETSCFLTTGNNASLALERALHYAVQRLMNDPDFIMALLSSN